jgi:hypothetical protein
MCPRDRPRSKCNLTQGAQDSPFRGIFSSMGTIPGEGRRPPERVSSAPRAGRSGAGGAPAESGRHHRNRWSAGSEISGRHRPKRVVDNNRNQRSSCTEGCGPVSLQKDRIPDAQMQPSWTGSDGATTSAVRPGSGSPQSAAISSFSLRGCFPRCAQATSPQVQRVLRRRNVVASIAVPST